MSSNRMPLRKLSALVLLTVCMGSHADSGCPFLDTILASFACATGDEVACEHLQDHENIVQDPNAQDPPSVDPPGPGPVINPPLEIAAWQPLGDGIDGPDAVVYGLTVYQDELIVSGSFTMAGGVAAHNIARWNGRDWSTYGDGMDDYVNCVDAWNGNLVAGGAFRHADGVAADRVARYDVHGWHPMADGMNASIETLLVMANGTLVAGGLFDMADGKPAPTHVAMWNENDETWEPLGSGITDGDVLALAEYDGDIFAGGSFSSIGGAITGGVARWDGQQWQRPGPQQYGPPRVQALAAYEGKLFALGSFTGHLNQTAERVAAWDGTAWAVLSPGLRNCQPAGMCGAMGLSACAFQGRLIAGGIFVNAGDAGAVNNIAAYDNAAWTGLHEGLTRPDCTADMYGCGPAVWRLFEYRGELIAGGKFTQAGDGPAMNIARWNSGPVTGP